MVHWAVHIARTVFATFMVLICMVPAFALEPIRVSDTDVAIDLTDAVDSIESTTGVLKISTAPDADGIVRRIEVRSEETERISHWAVFALANTSDQQIDRLIVAPHYRLVGSGLIWPDLDSQRIEGITPSEGFSLDRQSEPGADVFLITLDPGAVITLVAEQTTRELPKLLLWEPAAFVEAENSYTLYHGIVLGISGLLAIFLTILFVVRGSSMFPATALIAWGVLAYVSVDFGFWNKVTGISAANNPFWRASTEVFLSASILIFLHAYLSLSRWNRNYSVVTLAWILVLIILMGIAIIQPSIATGLARFSFAATFIFASALLVVLAGQRSDRAVMLFPTWILLGFWLLGAVFAVTGRLENDIIQPALAGGLVLIVLLLAFTIMQHAFSGGAFAQGFVSDTERSALALTGSGDILWDWDVGLDRIQVSEEILGLLNYGRKFLNATPNEWQTALHPNDRDKFVAAMKAMLQHKRGRISQTIRLRGADGYFHWFKLRARPLLDIDGEVARCVGTMMDVTDQKKSEERLLMDSVKDHLTGLENREMLAGRLQSLVELAKSDQSIRPTVIHIDIDEFRGLNGGLGYNVGDTILLTVSRRLSRLLKGGDSLARLSGDQFLLLLLSENEPKKIAAFADGMRRALKAPIEFAEQEITLSASIGMASWTHEHESAEDMLRDAELAKGEAKRLGGDKTIPFSPQLRNSKLSNTSLREELKDALQNDQIDILYQPIYRLSDTSIVGFEALVRWEHPELGPMLPVEFVPVAEQSGLISQLGNYVLGRSLKEFAEVLPIVGENAFVSVNISSRELLKPDIVYDITNALQANGLSPKNLRLEVTETMVMENPEYASQILRRIRSTGVGLSMDDFGSGYSSLSYLLKFPFDTLKIDKSFIQSRRQQEKLVVLKSIITLAKGLNQSIVAEGVEFETDAADLLQLGCPYAQGFYFSKPVKAGEIEGLYDLDSAVSA